MELKDALFRLERYVLLRCNCDDQFLQALSHCKDEWGACKLTYLAVMQRIAVIVITECICI